MAKLKTVVLTVNLLIIIALTGCNRQEVKSGPGLSGDLVIFHAGSLAVPFKEIADSFMLLNPGVKIKAESAGSLASIRKITDLKRPCDILASADYNAIDKMMIPGYASWCIKFAGNEMAVVFNDDSQKAGQINTGNWYSILLNPEVKFGRSDPDSDPCGYRAIMTLRLAEKYYNQPGLTDKFLAKDSRFIRPKEVDLLALLESDAIDYIFIYKSVAIQHKLQFLQLPDSINLGNPELTDLYRQVTVDVAGNKPGEYMSQHGEPMIYGVTIPKNSQNPSVAKAFVEFLITRGLKIMEESGQSLITPSVTGDRAQLPDNLKSYFD